MRLVITLLYCTVLPLVLGGQVANAGFEQWQTRDSIIEPLHWRSSNYMRNGNTYEWVKPSTLARSGQFAAYISNEPQAGFEPSAGAAYTFFKPIYAADTLCVYVNIPDSISMDGRPVIQLGSRGLPAYEFFSVAFDTNITNGYQLWKIPFAFTALPDSVRLTIYVGNELFYQPGAYFDDFYLTGTLGQPFQRPMSIEIFPNPAYSYLKLRTAKPINRVKILSARGEVLKDQVLAGEKLSLEGLPSGCYSLRIFFHDGQVASRFFVVE